MYGLGQFMLFRKNKTINEKHSTENLKSTKKNTRKKNVTSGCSHSYGFLAVRSKNSPIPQECLFCLQVVECLYKTKK